MALLKIFLSINGAWGSFNIRTAEPHQKTHSSTLFIRKFRSKFARNEILDQRNLSREILGNPMYSSCREHMASGLLSDIWPDFSFDIWNSLNPEYNGYFYFDHICNIMIIKYLTTNDESVPITFMARVSLTIGREQKFSLILSSSSYRIATFFINKVAILHMVYGRNRRRSVLKYVL